MRGVFEALSLCLTLSRLRAVTAQPDTLGLEGGYTTIRTRNFDLKLVSDSQVLASLKPSDQAFDFLPFDYLPLRARDGNYHWGDITLRYRSAGSKAWIDADSSARRRAVVRLDSPGPLAESDLSPTLPAKPKSTLAITRRWLDVDGDLGLEFAITNNRKDEAVEIGSLGFPAEFNSIFTNRSAEETQEKCSLSDPYIGMDGGYIQAVPVSGVGPALVVTPLGNTPLEAYRNLVEAPDGPTNYGSQVFEGFYEWQTLTKAWAENEWNATKPWNRPSSRTLKPGESLTVGLRFSVVLAGVRALDESVRATGTPVVRSIPGYIVPRDLPAQLLIQPSAGSNVLNITADPTDAFTIKALSNSSYELTPSTASFGRVRVTIEYSNRKVQTVHYLITKPATEAVSDMGRFLTTAQWFNDTDDPFHRAPSVMSYDYQEGRIVQQDDRVWIAGLSDEGGAGSFLAAAIKQAILPDAQEMAKLEAFVDGVLWGVVQTADYAVRKSIFFYEPAVVPGFKYDRSLTWTGWPSWDKKKAYATNRAYDYVHVAATYWALYRAGRGYPELLNKHGWEWYLNQSYSTVVRSMARDAGENPLAHYTDFGWMGETVIGELLADLKREGWATEASSLEGEMKKRAKLWSRQAVPFGSEMAWDSTGQEGVYYWAKHFGYSNAAKKAVDTVVGFTPTVPHWGWNGNSRRYWDNIYGGKLRRIERQIHHYGSALNSLVALSAFRSNPADSHLLRIGYAGMNGPLSAIHQDGFAAASFHSFPDTLAWDGYSGDYGPGFVGLALGAATYIVQDPDLGVVPYGGIIASKSDETITILPRDAARRAIFIAPIGVLLRVDAGGIRESTFKIKEGEVTITVSQTELGPQAPTAVLWIEMFSKETNYSVVDGGYEQARGGWKVPLSSEPVKVTIKPT